MMWFVKPNDNTAWLTKSKDLMNWTAQRNVMTGVTSLSVIKDGSLYKMWFVYSGKIYYAYSSDGSNWTKNSTPVLSPGPYYQLSVVKIDSTYHMWYGAGSYRIYHATGNDGLAWTVCNNGNPVINVQSYDPSVVYDSISGTYCMTYVDYAGGWYKLMYVTSSNGDTWSSPQATSISANGSYPDYGALLREGGLFKLIGTPGQQYAYCYESADGVNWLCKNPSSAMLLMLSDRFDPCVVWDGTQYAAYVCHATAGVYKLTGPDGRHWSSVVPYLPDSYQHYSGGEYAWGYTHPDYASVVVEGGTTRTWFSASPAAIYLDVDGQKSRVSMAGSGFTSPRYPSVINDNGVYKMWLTGTVSNRDALIYAESTNGSSFAAKKVDLIGAAASKPRVIRDGSIYRMWYSSTNAIRYAESMDGINWDIKNYGDSFLKALADSYYAYSVSTPSVIQEGSSFRMWFTAKKTTEGANQIGYAEWTPPTYQAIGTKTAMDTSAWGELSSVTTIVRNAQPNDVKILLSPNDYDSLMAYRDGRWCTVPAGDWDTISRNAEHLYDFGMTASELGKLGYRELAHLLAAGDELQVVAIFDRNAMGRLPSLESISFNFTAQPAQYVAAKQHSDSSTWLRMNRAYATIMQPEYAKVRFFASNDGGNNLRVYRAGSWTSYAKGGGTDLQCAVQHFSDGMTREEIEVLSAAQWASLLPASGIDLYSVHELYSTSTEGYSVQFSLDWVAKHVLNGGQLHLLMDDGIDYSYTLTRDELQAFVEWVDQREKGKGSSYYLMPMSASAPFTRIFRRIYHSKIIQFDVKEN